MFQNPRSALLSSRARHHTLFHTHCCRNRYEYSLAHMHAQTDWQPLTELMLDQPGLTLPSAAGGPNNSGSGGSGVPRRQAFVAGGGGNSSNGVPLRVDDV